MIFFYNKTNYYFSILHLVNLSEIQHNGNILVRQRETKIYSGINVDRGSDDTLFAKVTGKVKFEILGRDKKKVSVYLVEERSAAK
ncbi:MAG: hypothetical protein HFJ32_05140 [Clostridia bacterium]|nr:hypothetical protein [Clostridia bacterium]